MQPMQKAIESKLAEKLGVTQKRADEILNTFIEIMPECIAEDQELRIRNFGTFKVKERAARTGRNPRTGETIQIPAKKVLQFKPAAKLASTVAGLE